MNVYNMCGIGGSLAMGDAPIVLPAPYSLHAPYPLAGGPPLCCMTPLGSGLEISF